MKSHLTSNNTLRLLSIASLGLILSACGGGGSSSSGGGSSGGGGGGGNVATSCVTVTDLGPTPVAGNNNFRLTNTCNFTVNARQYSVGFVGTTTTKLAPGASAVDDFFVTPGTPQVFACKDPSQPVITLGGGVTTTCT